MMTIWFDTAVCYIDYLYDSWLVGQQVRLVSYEGVHVIVQFTSYSTQTSYVMQPVSQQRADSSGMLLQGWPSNRETDRRIRGSSQLAHLAPDVNPDQRPLSLTTTAKAKADADGTLYREQHLQLLQLCITRYDQFQWCSGVLYIFPIRRYDKQSRKERRIPVYVDCGIVKECQK